MAQGQFGVELGGGRHLQRGSFTAPCGCTFSGGVGDGFMGALYFELPALPGLSAGVKAGVDYKQFTSAHSWTTGQTYRIDSNQIGSITLEDNADIRTTYLILEPYARYRLFSTPAFLQVGAGISYLASSHFYQFRQLPNGMLFTNGSSTQVVEDGSVQDIRSMRYSAILSAGYDISLLGMTVAPMITYDLPLTDIRAVNANGWRIASLYGSVAFRFSP